MLTVKRQERARIRSRRDASPTLAWIRPSSRQEIIGDTPWRSTAGLWYQSLPGLQGPLADWRHDWQSSTAGTKYCTWWCSQTLSRLPKLTQEAGTSTRRTWWFSSGTSSHDQVLAGMYQAHILLRPQGYSLILLGKIPEVYLYLDLYLHAYLIHIRHISWSTPTQWAYCMTMYTYTIPPIQTYAIPTSYWARY